jgi:hypothetical protein
MTSTELHEETHLKVLRLLEGNMRLSQREVSEALGVGLGKTNFCIKALWRSSYFGQFNKFGSCRLMLESNG